MEVSSRAKEQETVSYRNRPWQDNPDLPDDGDVNELVDTLPNEDAHLDNFIEDLLTGPEPYEPGPFTGDDNSDPGFYGDSDFDDDAPY